MREDARGALPVRLGKRFLVFDKMAEAVPDRPRSAGQLARLGLTAEPGEPLGVILGQARIIPADGAADLVVMRVEPARGVMRRRDAAGTPVGQSAQAAGAASAIARTLARACPSSCGRSSAQGDPAPGPQIGRQAAPSATVLPSGSKRQALDAAGAEVPAGDDGARRNAESLCDHVLDHGWNRDRSGVDSINSVYPFYRLGK